MFIWLCIYNIIQGLGPAPKSYRDASMLRTPGATSCWHDCAKVGHLTHPVPPRVSWFPSARLPVPTPVFFCFFVFFCFLFLFSSLFVSLPINNEAEYVDSRKKTRIVLVQLGQYLGPPHNLRRLSNAI
jgi:hypothetical protein